MEGYTYIGIIYNPKSTGPSEENARNLASRIRKKWPKQQLACIATKRAGHAEQLAYDIAIQHQTPLVISSSGDGGYNEVINGAMNAKKAGYDSICAVLPSGNANDHRRTLRRESLIKGILGKNITEIDLLHADIRSAPNPIRRYAHSYIGLGLTPVIATELNRHTLNRFREIWIVLKAFYAFKSFELKVNSKRVVFDSLIFSNIHRMAKVLKLAEKSRVRDGKFEVTFFPHSRKLALLSKLAWAVLSHSLPNQRTDRYEFTTIKKLPMQLDGEVLQIPAGTKVNITCHQQALQTIL